MQDIKMLVIGASGTGCSSLADALSNHLKTPHFDGDDYYWEQTDPPFTNKMPIELRQELLKKDLYNHKSWIFSGSPETWAPFVQGEINFCIFLYAPWPVRKNRIHNREISRFGDRVLSGGDMYQKHQDFLEWSRSYDTTSTSSRSLVRHNNLPNAIKCPVLRIEGDIKEDAVFEMAVDFIDKNNF